MTDNEFDDIIQNRLLQHESLVPADMWQRIHADEKKKKPAFLWISYVIALLLFLFISGTYLFNGALNKKETSVKTILTNKNKNDANTISKTQKPVASTTPVGINNDINFPANSSKNKSQRYGSFQHTKIANNVTSYNKLNNKHNDNASTDDDTIFQQDRLTDTIRENQNNNIHKAERLKLPPESSGSIDSTNTADIEMNDDNDKVSIQLFVSPDMPFSSIGSPDVRYQSLLKNTIKARLSYTIGAGINFHVAKRFSLSTGIQYSRVNETISFTDSTLSIQSALHNHLSFINLPFTATYNTKWTRAFQTSINTGIMLNILSHYKGNMPDQFGELENINNVYKSNTSLSIYTGLNFSRSISNQADVFAEPYFRFQTKNITDDIQPFTRSITTTGIELGIRYKLFRDEKNE